MRPNIRQIAAELGVSTATVSRVINNKPDVKPQERQRVLEYLRNIDYEPAMVSANLKLIGIIDTFERHKLNSYYLAELVAGVDERLHTHGYNAVLIHADQVEKEVRQFGQVKMFKNLDGVLWFEPLFNNKYLEILKRHKLPCVVVNNCESGVDVDVVQSANREAAIKAVDLLVGNGLRDIGFLGGWLNLTNHKDRFEGYLEGLTRNGIDVRREIIIDDIVAWNEEGGYEGMHRLLLGSVRLDAVLLCSDFLATGAYQAVKELNLRIPGDISLISFDDFPLAPYLDPPLTTFRQPLHDIAVKASDRLLDMITVKSNRPHEGIFLPCQLVMRKSVRIKNLKKRPQELSVSRWET